MLDFSIYVLYRAASAIVGLIPLRVLFTAGEFFGFIAWLVSPQYRRLARENLQIAFGREQSARQLSRLTRKHFQRLGSSLLCTVKIGTMPLEKAAKHLTIGNVDVVHNELRAGRPVVFVLSHLGPWELLAQLLARELNYVRLGVVYQQLGNRYIDADVRQKRARAGVELFDRREGFHGAIELLRCGGVMGVLSDQHAGDQGLWTPFFGRLASTSPLPGLLAKRTKAVVISAAVYTSGTAQWRVEFTSHLNEPRDSVESITAKANVALAEQISVAPEDWFWVHNRWKTPKPNFLLQRYKRGVYLPPETSTTLKPFRILIRGTNWLGDSVISVPAVRAIKSGRPDAHVTVAAPEKLAAVWKLVPEVDEVLPLPASSPLGVARLLRSREAFDVAVLFPKSLRSALEVWLAGIPRRVGFAGHHRRALLNQVVPDLPRNGPIQHQVHEYLHIARHLGADVASATLPPIASRNGNDDQLVLGLCPGAEYGPAKRWLPERFAEVAARVAGERAVQWVLFGTAADAESGKIIADALGARCDNRIGRTTLDELTAELRRCRLLLTNDTGTMHLATLLGVPVVAVFGSTEHRLTGPLGDRNVVVRHHVECSPCFLRKCPIDFRCMHAVTSDEVVAQVLAALPA
ncbi:MAG: ADP-heptose--lipooligosaccharide heptosyltransferase II [uncultured Chthoniobacterales bacterium]|uniref:lipopolysaccharide heptosyltransferase II n=1 Tax=uncultured Chthoniobacterales bacterium TaxID=1836801 RepID=A0A6J4HZZ9_9BACT|nr:MAG: ADP-heptose--lipooligosaccharide heptosyltransferase II [uncultured Chthoniobacterales bacterium]